MFVCCHKDNVYNKISSYFKEYNNVKFIKLKERLDFTKFNSEVFCIPRNKEA